jgi:hypothetical protein
MEKEMRQASKQRFWAIKEVVAHYAALDTVPSSTIALIHFLADSLPDKQWNRLAVGVAISADTLPWARNILDSLSLETADDSVFYAYHDLAISLKEDTLTWFDMDSTQHALVNSIAAGSSSTKLRAQAVQTIIGDSVYARLPEHLPYTPEFRLAEEEPVSEASVSDAKVTVFPNPFSNQFNVAWELENDEAVLQFEVFDLTGRLTHSEQLQASKIGRHVLNLGECQGFYILRVSENNRELINIKLLCLGN